MSADIKTFLTRQNKFQAFQKFLEGLKQNATIEYMDDSINPKNIKKQLDEALAEQIKAQEQKNNSEKKAK